MIKSKQGAVMHHRGGNHHFLAHNGQPVEGDGRKG